MVYYGVSDMAAPFRSKLVKVALGSSVAALFTRKRVGHRWGRGLDAYLRDLDRSDA